MGFLDHKFERYEKCVDNIVAGFTNKESQEDKGVHDARMYHTIGASLIKLDRKEEADDWHKKAADRGLFYSQWQRSIYNANRRLTAKPWWDVEKDGNKALKDAKALLEANWDKIQQEGLSIMDNETGLFRQERERLSKTGDWKQFVLYGQGQQKQEACEKTPFTCILVQKIPDATSCKRGQIKFSLMHSGIQVYPHTGPTNCRLRMHLTVQMPTTVEKPKIRVLNETREWEEGKVFVFDDSFEHEVWWKNTTVNDPQLPAEAGKPKQIAYRLVLIVDIWHPDLTEAEKKKLTPI